MMAKLVVSLLVLGMMGCSTPPAKQATARTLPPPATAQPAAKAAMEEGTRLLKEGQVEAAKTQYEAAIKAQPTLAEAHYNLAVTLDALKQQKDARVHYREAANLAPGHKIIWSSPIFRGHTEDIDGLKSKNNSFMDAKPY